MKLITRARFIGSTALLVASAGGVAMAAAPPGVPGAEAAPTTCENATTPESPEMAKEDAAREPYGPVELVADALAKVCLSDDQRAAIEKLGKQVGPKERAVAEARHALVAALAEQLRSGTIDENALKDKVDALAKARQDAAPAMHKAIDGLHGILDAGQRNTFVDAIEGRVKGLAQASSGWSDSIAKDLGFTDDQKHRIQDVLGKEKPELRKERDTVAAAFEGFRKDDFSTDKVIPVADVGDQSRAEAEGMIATANEIVPILTADQRGMLADKIESKPNEAPASPPSRSPSGTDTTQQGIFAARGFRAGAVGGWGGGFGYGRAGFVGMGAGYRAGFPFWRGPGIW
jgi:Spy/CpxP family protein refolding chaperone